MNKKLGISLAFVGVLVLTLGLTLAASAVSGAAFTTYNPWVDGDFKDVCKNSQINCNIYGAKPDVWLNGGPAANGLGPDGEYFFAVLVPGGQPDPNDGGAKNLSDDYDAYTNRQFTVTDGEVSYYGGTHGQDSGDTQDPLRDFCTTPRGCAPDGSPPFIRLFPYADTWNPGGVYILAICYIGDGSLYPVEPSDCKYDAFKVKEGQVTYELMLKGMTFKDPLPDGPINAGPHPWWSVQITGTGFAGEDINVIVSSDNGYWDYGVSYTFNKSDTVVAAELTICEIQIPGWYQTWPAGDACYEITIEPAAMAFRGGLDFGNWFIGLPRW